MSTPTPQEFAAAIRDAWLLHKRLRYKLHPHQRVAYDKTRAQFEKPRWRRYAWRMPRRSGKTFTSQVIVVESCLRVPGSRYVVAAPSEKHLEKFVHPAIATICADAPEECRPTFDRAASEYKFPNGSIIALYGCDTDRKIDLMGRGPAAHGIVFEEAGAIPNLSKARTVTGPQLLSTRKLPGCGWMLYVGTPPESAAHYFVTVCKAYREKGTEHHCTVYDTHYTPEELDVFMEEDADGTPPEEYKQSDDYKREWLGHLIPDQTRKVLKSATEERLAECIARYRAVKRPSHFMVYEGLDVGWQPDWTFWVMAWWDYRSRTLVVEAERFWRNGFKHEEMAAAIIEEERRLLHGQRVSPFHLGYKPPQRWSDYSPILLAELADKHDVVFNHTAKDDRDTAIANCDRMLPGHGVMGKLAINPECKELLKQMENAIWNKARTEFAKDNPKRYGHYDGVAALVYLTRNVVRDENPFPPSLYDVDRSTHYVVEEPDTRLPEDAAWAKAFGLEEDAA